MRKKCKTCKIVKEYKEFYFNKVSNCYFSKCKSCSNIYAKMLIRKRRKIPGTYEWYRKKYDSARYSSSLKGREFLLTYKEYADMLKKESCYYCKMATNRLTIDRMDNSKGYTQQNCVGSCWACNKLKGGLSLDALKSLKNIADSLL